CDRARSPAHKATGPADARVQPIRDGGRADSGHLVGRENQKTTVQTANRKSSQRSGNLGPRSWPLSTCKVLLARHKHILNKICTRTVPSKSDVANLAGISKLQFRSSPH